MSRKEVGGAQPAWGSMCQEEPGQSNGISTKTHQLPIGKHHLSQGGSQILNADHGITLGNFTSIVNHPAIELY